MKKSDEYRIQGVQIVIEKALQARDRLRSSLPEEEFQEYEPYLLGMKDACEQIIYEIQEGLLPEIFHKGD